MTLRPPTPASSRGATAGVVASAATSWPAPPVAPPLTRTLTLTETVRSVMQRLEYSPRTQASYAHWIRGFVRFHDRRHPLQMAVPEIAAYLDHLTTNRRAAASTRNQALCAIAFLYRHVHGIELPALGELERARRPLVLPTVLTRKEALRVIARLEHPFKLIVQLLFGSGLRLMECLSLRLKDVDLAQRHLTVRRSRGGKERMARLLGSVVNDMRRQMERVAALHEAALSGGLGEADLTVLPQALLPVQPGAAGLLEWQYLFPASRPRLDERTGGYALHHLHESAVQRAIHEAAGQARMSQRVTAHTFRHSFATEMLRAHVDIRTVQALLGHEELSTTMIYAQLVEQRPLDAPGPLDR